MMKILFVMPTHLSYGGIESVAINLWKALLNRGHEINFVCHGCNVGAFEDEITQKGSRVYHIPIKGNNYWGTIKKFKEIIINDRYDVVHAHMNATSGIYLEIAKKQGVKVLVAHSHASTMRAFSNNPLKSFINLIEKKRTNKYANIRIACSDKAGKWLFGNKQYTVVMNAVDVKRLAYSPGIRKKKKLELRIGENEFVAMHVGGFLECKNHLYLIEIFSQICRLEKNAKLILVGDGPLHKELVKRIQVRGLESHVLMLGQRSDVSELLQVADVFLLPSKSEGNPVALAEAAASGLHCLVSNQVAKDIARYFAPGNIDFLPISGERVIEKWAECAVASWERITYCKEYPCSLTIENMAEQTESLYVEAFNGEKNE